MTELITTAFMESLGIIPFPGWRDSNLPPS